MFAVLQLEKHYESTSQIFNKKMFSKNKNKSENEVAKI